MSVRAALGVAQVVVDEGVVPRLGKGRLDETTLGRGQIERLGARMTLMSGSGPTVFALFEREQQARRVFNALRRTMKEVYLCQTC